MGKYAVLSDIHGNIQAWEEVCRDLSGQRIEGVILLGDLIDYGMQSNEVVSYIRNEFRYPIVCSVWGNHEKAILTEDYTGFSSQRGIDSAKNTAAHLTQDTKKYLESACMKSGKAEFELGRIRCLAVHGSLEEPYWKAIGPDNVRGEYAGYDVVFSGHSHYSHVFTKFYPSAQKRLRNRKAVLFVNPGSVGQPRNQNPHAQYAVFDSATRSVELRAVLYDVKEAMEQYNGSVDIFYRDRLREGV